MKKWLLVDEVKNKDGKIVTLHHQEGIYIIKVDGADLMSTRQHASEEKLAEIACERIKHKKNPRILIGGLGFGFTLRAALAHAPLSVKVVVAELMKPVITWNKNPAYRLAYVPMNDRRVSVVQKDVADVIRQRPQGFDAILMDVDNGPRALSTDQNSFLYQPVGLAQIFKATRPGGCVGFWSATEDPSFAKAMKKVGFEVDIQKCRAHPTSGGMHTLFFGHVKEAKPAKKSKKEI